MGIKDTDVIDVIAKDKGGGLVLSIADGGVTDPQKRFELLIAKLKTYVGYVMSDEFRKKHPGVKPKDVKIMVFCETEPTEQMKQIEQVAPAGDRENLIPVNYGKI